MSTPDQQPDLDRLGQRGSVLENRVTGERAVVLDDGQLHGTAIAHLTVQPNGAVAGEHVHPAITERFKVLDGELATRIAGNERTLTAGEELTVTPGVPHDWWNGSQAPTSVIVELDPPDLRFAIMLATLFGLANSGRTNSKGMPGALQGALLAREFSDVIRFTHPPAGRASAGPACACCGRPEAWASRDLSRVAGAARARGARGSGPCGSRVVGDARSRSLRVGRRRDPSSPPPACLALVSDGARAPRHERMSRC
jgi:mannose-6-phosphate isomerase-like protein (cupin superfamily)